ncbi:MAG: hypothetical protein ABEJ68_04920 [Halobacteriaceae archaeon]
MRRSRPDPSNSPGTARDEMWESDGDGPTAPLGIKLICVLSVFLDLFALLVGLAAVGGGGPESVIGLVLLVIVAVDLTAVYGLWTVKSWGWVLAVAMRTLSLLAALVQGELVGFLVGLLILGYVVSKYDLYLG